MPLLLSQVASEVDFKDEEAAIRAKVTKYIADALKNKHETELEVGVVLCVSWPPFGSDGARWLLLRPLRVAAVLY